MQEGIAAPPLGIRVGRVVFEKAGGAKQQDMFKFDHVANPEMKPLPAQPPPKPNSLNKYRYAAHPGRPALLPPRARLHTDGSLALGPA